VIVIFKKMLLTGAMTIVKPGSSAQLSIALIIVLFNMLLELKLAPYADEADDWLAFLTNIQMLLTIQGGLLLMTDDSSVPTYDKRLMGITLVVVNSFGFVAFFLSLLVLHPSIRNRLEKYTDAKQKKRSGTKIVPQSGAEKKKNDITTKTTNHSDNNNDQVTPLQNIKVMPQEAADAQKEVRSWGEGSAGGNSTLFKKKGPEPKKRGPQGMIII
jgi:hypothetical protein